MGDKEDLLSSQLKIKEVNFHKYDSIPANFQAEVKIRYHDKGHLATIVQENNELTIHCSQPVEAVTPGQSAVIYENDDVIAGGFIL
ncbi:MAG: aminomethyltransferase beta-barrel domain-containing protein [Bacteroidales bacterium]